MKAKVSTIIIYCSPVTEAVAVSTLIAIASLVLRYGWTGNKKTDIQTIVVVYFQLFESKTLKTKNNFVCICYVLPKGEVAVITLKQRQHALYLMR